MSATIWWLAAAAVFVASLPYWLPAAVVRMRMFLLTRINGKEGIELPDATSGTAGFREAYGQPAVSGRSKGAELSDLFWYWLSPGAHLHQEHIEAGPTYDALAGLTKRILARSRRETEALVNECAARHLGEAAAGTSTLARVRNLALPIWADFYYELVFGERCPAHAREIICDHARNMAAALKCYRLRDMRARNKLTELLRDKLAAGDFAYNFPPRLTMRERALFLQGVFFTTGMVQMTDATSHVLMALAHHPVAQDRFVANDDPRYCDNVIAETLRLYPLFGIAHRITKADFVMAGDRVVPSGSVVCFNYPKFHQQGYDEPEKFLPERWEQRQKKSSNYLPFGAPGNRACPAQAVALASLMAVTKVALDKFDLRSSAAHTRSISNGGPCLLLTRGSDASRIGTAAKLAWIKLADDWGNVGRSILQLVFGTTMVIDARRQRLCRNHFANTGVSGQLAPVATGETVSPDAARTTETTAA